MLQKITDYSQIKKLGIGGIVLEHNEIGDRSFKIVKFDNDAIKLTGVGRFPILMIVPVEDFVSDDWYIAEQEEASL